MKKTCQFLAVTLVLSLPTLALAQPGGGRGGFGGPGDRGGIGRLLMSDQVRTELEIVDDQQAELEAMGDEMRDKMRELFSGMRGLSREERREKMEELRGEMQSVRAEVESRLGEILMPAQLERLKQIELQQQVQRQGTAALTRGSVAEELGITEEQQAEMREKAATAQAELQAKIAELRKAAREEVLSVLTSSQRAKLDALMGEDFTLERQQRQRGQGRRDRGDAEPELN